MPNEKDTQHINIPMVIHTGPQPDTSQSSSQPIQGEERGLGELLQASSTPASPGPGSSQSITPHGSPIIVEPSSIRSESDLEKPSPDTQTTSSSKETSSDKLSALPPPALPPSRGETYRRSLETSPSTSHSLPVFPSAGILTNTGEPALDASFISLPASNNWHPTAGSSGNVDTGHHGETFPRASASEGSISKETPKQRVSFEDERAAFPSFQNIRQTFSRGNRGSDPSMSPALRPADARPLSIKQKDGTPQQQPSGYDSPNILASPTPSLSRGRATSPLRFLREWSAGLHRAQPREEPFVPIDPYKFGWKIRFPRFCYLCGGDEQMDDLGIPLNSLPDIERPYSCGDTLPTCCPALPSKDDLKIFLSNTNIFLTDMLPRQLYLHLLLRLPALYFSRVARLFEEAEVSRPDIQRMIETGVGGGFIPQAPTGAADASGPVGGAGDTSRRGALASGIGLTTHIGTAASMAQVPLPFPEDWTPPLVSPALVRFKNSWEAFIDSLLREWKTLNVVSALLLSAILGLFQNANAADDPVTRTAALLSLICALMSLSYGCVYIVRFGTMRSMYRASRWAEEARKNYTLIWWNVWVLLAMPAVWLAWSMICFVVSVLSFVWRTGSTNDPPDRRPLSPDAALGPRIAITGMLFLGLVYFALIIKTLKRYGGNTSERGKGRVTLMNMSPRMRHRDVEADGSGERQRARDIDAAMERRGRGREARRGENAREKETKGVMGLGLTGVGGAAEQGVMELEKGELDRVEVDAVQSLSELP